MPLVAAQQLEVIPATRREGGSWKPQGLGLVFTLFLDNLQLMAPRAAPFASSRKDNSEG